MGRKSKRQKTTKKPQLNPPPPPQQPPLDRLSDLPDAIIIDILSLLPTITAVTTSVLSQRWRHLWTQITSLHLNYNDFPLESSDFYADVDQILSQITSPVIRTFSLHAPYPCPQHFDPWLRNICARQVREIDVTMEDEDDVVDGNSSLPFTLPICIFQTQTIVCLHLPTYYLKLPNDDDVIIQLPNLNKLLLYFSASDCGLIAKLVRSCPLLEDLSLTAAKCWWVNEAPNSNNDIDNNSALIDISCENLKILHLNLLAAFGNEQVVIDTPKLDCFSLLATGLVSCSVVKKPIGLRKATIITTNHEVASLVFPMICNVRVLSIFAPTIGLFEVNSSKFPSLIKFAQYIVIPHSSQHVNKDQYELNEMFFCIDLYSCSLKAPHCMIEFWGQCAELPKNNAELREMRSNVQVLRELVSMQDVASSEC